MEEREGSEGGERKVKNGEDKGERQRGQSLREINKRKKGEGKEREG